MTTSGLTETAAEAEMARSLLGSSVRKFCRKYAGYFEGVVSSFDPQSRRYTIRYEDGVQESVPLRTLVRYLPREQSPAVRAWLCSAAADSASSSQAVMPQGKHEQLFADGILTQAELAHELALIASHAAREEAAGAAWSGEAAGPTAKVLHKASGEQEASTTVEGGGQPGPEVMQRTPISDPSVPRAGCLGAVDEKGGRAMGNEMLHIERESPTPDSSEDDVASSDLSRDNVKMQQYKPL